MSDLFAPLSLACGLTMKNRFMLAPLTNQQSHVDGTLSEEEFHWLTMRAQGGFAVTTTCASHVTRGGQGFPGQLGVWSDDHLPGLTRLAGAIKAAGSLAFLQLHHAGVRSPVDVIGEAPVGPSDDPKFGARGLTSEEVEGLIESFIEGAVRSEKAGFDGVEIHGAHGYILCAFLSPTMNRREDDWGGSLENRSRIIFEIMRGIRARCSPGFGLALRLSPERFGMKLDDARQVAQQAMTMGGLDILDMSLWDVAKEPEEEAFKGRSLISYFTELDRGSARLGVAGKITSAADARSVMEHGADFPILGRAAVLRHDFPERVRADPDYRQPELPVTRAHLEAEGLSPSFVQYMRNWEGFVADDEPADALLV